MIRHFTAGVQHTSQKRCQNQFTLSKCNRPRVMPESAVAQGWVHQETALSSRIRKKKHTQGADTQRERESETRTKQEQTKGQPQTPSQKQSLATRCSETTKHDNTQRRHRTTRQDKATRNKTTTAQQTGAHNSPWIHGFGECASGTRSWCTVQLTKTSHLARNLWSNHIGHTTQSLQLQSFRVQETLTMHSFSLTQTLHQHDCVSVQSPNVSSMLFMAPCVAFISTSWIVSEHVKSSGAWMHG